jgi:hypothetical protein
VLTGLHRRRRRRRRWRQVHGVPPDRRRPSEGDDILSGKLKKMDDHGRVSLAYALTTTLCYLLEEVRRDEARAIVNGNVPLKAAPDYKRVERRGDNFLGFIMNNFKPEIAIMGAKAALAVHKLPFDTQKMKNFQVFAEQVQAPHPLGTTGFWCGRGPAEHPSPRFFWLTN